MASPGSIQLLLGPASSFFGRQTNVRCSVLATSVGWLLCMIGPREDGRIEGLEGRRPGYLLFLDADLDELPRLFLSSLHPVDLGGFCERRLLLDPFFDYACHAFLLSAPDPLAYAVPDVANSAGSPAIVQAYILGSCPCLIFFLIRFLPRVMCFRTSFSTCLAFFAFTDASMSLWSWTAAVAFLP